MSDTDASFISHPSSSSASLIEPPSNNDADNELDSLPSSEPDSDDDVTISEDYTTDSDAEREWKESMQQLELLLSLVIIPYMGKYFGRKFAFWGWKRFMEWNYPVQIVTTSKAAARGAGVVAAASL